MKVTSAWENRVCDPADELGISYGEAERKLQQLDRVSNPSPVLIRSKTTKAPRQPREKQHKEPSYTYAKVIRMAIASGRDCIADNPEMQIEDAAYDLADGLLFDPMVMRAIHKNYVKNHNRNPSRQILKEILADYVAEGGYQAQKKQKR